MTGRTREELRRELGAALRAYHAAVEAIDDAACAYMGINRTDLRCLDVLGRAGPMTAGRLAEESMLTNAGVTVVVDRLERIGYVRRTRDTTDRRRVMVEATAKAHRRAWTLYGNVAESLFAQLEGYSDDELALLRDFLRERTEIDAEIAAEFAKRLPKSPGKAQREPESRVTPGR
jgi:DNA-binding MarR family transcriptional regulator